MREDWQKELSSVVLLFVLLFNETAAWYSGG
jgi:hypothetical protein